jgi:L-fuculose-phosphate aldolase
MTMTAGDARDTLAQAVIDTALAMERKGINQGKAGNVSARLGTGFLITPTGMEYDRLTPSDIVWMGLDGTVPAGQRAPSSEWRMHLDIYSARPEAGAVVHAHSVQATALACLHRGIPSFHYMVAVAGGRDIRCSEYALFGTQALSDAMLAALADRRACLLGNHGQIALGADLGKALALAVEVETLAAQYLAALSAGLGEPALLSATQMDEALERFRTYGRQPDAKDERTAP